MNKYIDHPLYGLRILHYISPIRFSSSGVFLHESCSNFKAVQKTINFLPMCHHYVTVPIKNNLINEKNVTYVPINYTKSAVLNRFMFDSKELKKQLNLTRRDFDFVFNHQPELMYNIITMLTERRYGESIIKFSFFHWVDNPSSRGSTQVPAGFMRQLEGINLSDKAFFHTSNAPEFFSKNIKKDSIVDINMENLKNRVELMPLAADNFSPTRQFELPNKKILVFNHRWNKSTGINMMEEYTRELRNSGEYIVWCTDESAPKEFVSKNLDFGKYRYLLENSMASMCFVDGYITWNLSVQDGIRLNKPVLIYRNSTLEKIVGDDYPFFFSNKEEFLEKLRNIPETFEWELDNFEKKFETNLHRTMIEKFSKKVNTSKYGPEWIKYILNGIKVLL